jgi:hypothetical protein
MADSVETELRMELTLCRAILNAIEQKHKESLRSQKVIPKCQKHLEILRQHQLEFNEHFDREDLTNDSDRRD